MDSLKIGSALKHVAFWVAMAILFGCGIYALLGADKGLQFFGGYLIELSLSIDNLFLFITIFTSFRVAEHARHRVLTYGIAGAVVLRFVFIYVGVNIVTRFEWVLYIFGILLVISGFKMLVERRENKNPHDRLAIRIFSKIIPITSGFSGERFIVKRHNRMYATPLFAVLVLIECSDILFAIDSVPAAFSVSTDLFIVYTSNIFAIIGLRQLYFVLDHLQERFRLVKYGVAVILMFTGFKLGILYFGVEISILYSIGFIVVVLLLSIVLSILFTPFLKKKR